MKKKLTITVDQDVYSGLYSTIGKRNISSFIETLLRPYVIRKDLDAEYAEMAKDEAAQAEAREWCEGLINDVSDEPR